MKMLIDKIKKFPLKPGIYKFIDKNNEILYIGRATNLRRRVGQYFQKSPLPPFGKGVGGLDPRISEMVGLAKDVKYQETDTLLEAVILEANLIKQHWPKYNVKDKDNRSFIYIAIPTKRRLTQNVRGFTQINYDFPRPLIVRGNELKKMDIAGVHVFGPYQSLTIVKNALKIIRRVFPYSVCKPFVAEGSEKSPQPPFKKGAIKPCFDYQIGLCPGICVGAISKEDYQKNIDDIILLLSGQKKRLLKKLKKENPEQIRALQHIQDVTLISEENQWLIDALRRGSGNKNQKLFRIEGYDISHLAGKETYGSMVVFENGKPNKEQYRLFKIKEAPASDDLRALAEVMERRLNHKEWALPDLIMIDGGKPQVEYIHNVLSFKRINIPVVGISKYAQRIKGESPLPPFKKGAGGLEEDKLVFQPKVKRAFKEMAQNLRPTLIKVRDEAHRFALKSSRRKRSQNL